jgi:2'-5' RNA ligase
VPVLGLEALAEAVRSATVEIGASDRHDFYGHVTIARLGRHTDLSLPATPLECEFEVEEIALVASELRSAGPTYGTIARFPTR